MSETQTDDTNATITALTNRLHDLEAATTSRINVLEAIVQTQQVPIDQLIAEQEAAQMGIRDTKMPRFLQNCRHYGTCKTQTCGFTHSKQRALFGNAIEGLPVCVKGGKTKMVG